MAAKKGVHNGGWCPAQSPDKLLDKLQELQTKLLQHFQTQALNNKFTVHTLQTLSAPLPHHRCDV